MNYEHIIFETQDGISTLTINRPEVMNALNRAAVEEISDALDWLRDERKSRVLLLTGAGRAFSSGADIGADLTPKSGRTDAGELLERHLNPLIERMFALPVPIVTAVNGVAAGAGCSVAFADGPTQAYAHIRQVVRMSMSSTLTDALMLERRSQMLASRTAGFAEGIAAFGEKRAPRFSGQLMSSQCAWHTPI